MAYRSKAPENPAQFEDAAPLSKEGGKTVLNLVQPPSTEKSV
jgi:hypothetical protein